MSFSSEVKAELCRLEPGSRQLAAAECFGIVLYSNTFTAREVKIVTGSEELAALLPRLFRRAFNIEFDSVTDKRERGKRILSITEREKIDRIFSAFGLEPGGAVHINLGALEEDGAREAFVRGAFLAGGSVTDPEKRYHMELSTSHYNVSRELPTLFIEMGFEPKSVTRGGNYVTYFKNSAVIEDVLTTIGAPVSAMGVMSAKIEKDMMNAVNRKVNCDTANVLKTVVASEEQIAAIKKLRDAGAFEAMPEKLREAAILREENPELSLGDLARAAGLTKSGLSHRMRKITELASTLN